MYNDKITIYIYGRVFGCQNSVNIRKYSGKIKPNTKLSLTTAKKNLVSRKLKTKILFLKQRSLAGIAKYTLGFTNTRKSNYLKKFYFSRLNFRNALAIKLLNYKSLEMPNLSDKYKINSLYVKLLNLYKVAFFKATFSTKRNFHNNPVQPITNTKGYSSMRKILVWLKKNYTRLFYLKFREFQRLFIFQVFNHNFLKKFMITKKHSYKSILLSKKYLYYSFIKMYKRILIFFLQTKFGLMQQDLSLNWYYDTDKIANTIMNRRCFGSFDNCSNKLVKNLNLNKETISHNYFSWVLKSYNRSKFSRVFFNYIKNTKLKNLDKRTKRLETLQSFFRQSRARRATNFMKYRIIYIKLTPRINNVFMNIFIKNKNACRMLYTCSYGTFHITKKKIRKTIFALKKFKKIIRKFLKVYLKSVISSYKPAALLQMRVVKYIILDIPQPFRNRYIISILNKIFKKKKNFRKKTIKLRSRTVPPIVYKTLPFFHKKLAVKKNYSQYNNIRQPRLLLASLKNLAHNGTRLKKPKRL